MKVQYRVAAVASAVMALFWGYTASLFYDASHPEGLLVAIFAESGYLWIFAALAVVCAWSAYRCVRGHAGLSCLAAVATLWAAATETLVMLPAVFLVDDPELFDRSAFTVSALLTSAAAGVSSVVVIAIFWVAERREFFAAIGTFLGREFATSSQDSGVLQVDAMRLHRWASYCAVALAVGWALSAVASVATWLQPGQGVDLLTMINSQVTYLVLLVLSAVGAGQLRRGRVLFACLAAALSLPWAVMIAAHGVSDVILGHGSAMQLAEIAWHASNIAFLLLPALMILGGTWRHRWPRQAGVPSA